jgi:hypothetical protein
MRAVFFAAGLLVTTSEIGARADTNYPWCSSGSHYSSNNCSYSTLAQCQAANLGNSECFPNNTYVAPGPAGGSHKKQKQQ